MTRSRIRIVHLVPNLNLGGAQRIAVHILRGLDPARFEPSAIVFCGPNGTQLEAMLEERGIPVTFLGKGPGFDLRAYSNVSAASRRHQPDVAHTHMQVLLYALPALKLQRISTLVHTIHNLAEHDTGFELRWVNRIAFQLGVLPVAIGPSVASSL